jgi:peptide/nickel transport system ATP-binding protein/oligopeptide transport system ATP-binding protein
MTEVLIEASGLSKHYVRPAARGQPGGVLRAADGVSIDIRTGETLGLVGESGCGKSTLCRLLVRLVEPTAGTIRFDGQDLLNLRGRALKEARRDLQFIFQDPYGSLDPRMTVRRIVGEGPKVHGLGSRSERDQAVLEMLAKVGLPDDAADRYPHEFSGGQRQRIGIARALVMRPRLVVADEPVSALDVSVQAQILNQLADLKRDLSLTLVFVTHNLAAVGYLSDRVAVMYLGKIVEIVPTTSLFTEPMHPYTQALLSSVSGLGEDGTIARDRVVLSGELPSAVNPPSGCRFRTRCPIAQDVCAQTEPPLLELVPGHKVACHFAGREAAA